MTLATTNYDGIAALVAAGFSGVATLITALNRRTATTTETKLDKTSAIVDDHSAIIEDTASKVAEVSDKVEAVHGEVATSNGHTLGQLVEQNLPPTLDNSVAPSRVDDGTPSGGLPGADKSPAPE